MSLFQLPIILQNNILDIYVNIKSYWQMYFTKNILPWIVAKQEHKNVFKCIHFELKAVYIKKELCKFSANNILFTFKHKPSKQSYERPYMWYILYDGFKFINGKSKRITLLFEIWNPECQNSHAIIESSGIFPYIDDEYGGYEDLGRTYIQNYPSFIEKFMNAIFTYRH